METILTLKRQKGIASPKSLVALQSQLLGFGLGISEVFVTTNPYVAGHNPKIAVVSTLGNINPTDLYGEVTRAGYSILNSRIIQNCKLKRQTEDTSISLQ